MRVGGTEYLVGRRVRLTFDDGSEETGVYDGYQSFAEDPDEPESFYIRDLVGALVDCPAAEVASIEEVA